MEIKKSSLNFKNAEILQKPYFQGCFKIVTTYIFISNVYHNILFQKLLFLMYHLNITPRAL